MWRCALQKLPASGGDSSYLTRRQQCTAFLSSPASAAAASIFSRRSASFCTIRASAPLQSSACCVRSPFLPTSPFCLGHLPLSSLSPRCSFPSSPFSTQAANRSLKRKPSSSAASPRPTRSTSFHDARREASELLAQLDEIRAQLQQIMPPDNELKFLQHQSNPRWIELQARADSLLSILYELLSGSSAAAASAPQGKKRQLRLRVNQFVQVFHRIHQQKLHRHTWPFYQLLKKQDPDVWLPKPEVAMAPSIAVPSSASDADPAGAPDSSSSLSAATSAASPPSSISAASVPPPSPLSLHFSPSPLSSLVPSALHAAERPFFYMLSSQLGLILTCIAESPTEGPEVAAAELDLIQNHLNSPPPILPLAPATAATSAISSGGPRMNFQIQAGCFNPILQAMAQRHLVQAAAAAAADEEWNGKGTGGVGSAAFPSSFSSRASASLQSSSSSSPLVLLPSIHPFPSPHPLRHSLLLSSLPSLRKFFSAIPNPDAFSYASMMNAEIEAGQVNEAMRLFERACAGDGGEGGQPSSSFKVSPVFTSLLLKKIKEAIMRNWTLRKEKMEQRLRRNPHAANGSFESASSLLSRDPSFLHSQNQLLSLAEDYWSRVLSSPLLLLDAATTGAMMAVYHAAGKNIPRMKGVIDEALAVEAKQRELYRKKMRMQKLKERYSVAPSDPTLDGGAGAGPAPTAAVEADPGPPVFVNPGCLNQLLCTLLSLPKHHHSAARQRDSTSSPSSSSSSSELHEYVPMVRELWQLMKEREKEAVELSQVAIFAAAELGAAAPGFSPALGSSPPPSPQLPPHSLRVRTLAIPPRTLSNYLHFLLLSSSSDRGSAPARQSLDHFLLEWSAVSPGLKALPAYRPLLLLVLDLLARRGGDFATAESIMNQFEQELERAGKKELKQRREVRKERRDMEAKRKGAQTQNRQQQVEPEEGGEASKSPELDPIDDEDVLGVPSAPAAPGSAGWSREVLNAWLDCYILPGEFARMHEKVWSTFAARLNLLPRSASSSSTPPPPSRPQPVHDAAGYLRYLMAWDNAWKLQQLQLHGGGVTNGGQEEKEENAAAVKRSMVRAALHQMHEDGLRFSVEQLQKLIVHSLGKGPLSFKPPPSMDAATAPVATSAAATPPSASSSSIVAALDSLPPFPSTGPNSVDLDSPFLPLWQQLLRRAQRRRKWGATKERARDGALLAPGQQPDRESERELGSNRAKSAAAVATAAEAMGREEWRMLDQIVAEGGERVDESNVDSAVDEEGRNPSFSSKQWPTSPPPFSHSSPAAAAAATVPSHAIGKRHNLFPSAVPYQPPSKHSHKKKQQGGGRRAAANARRS